MAKRKSLNFTGILTALTQVLARNDVGNDLRREIDVTPRQWDRFLDFEKECISTVNVIELVDGKVIGMTSYLDTPDGTRMAEARFKWLHTQHNDPDGTTGIERPTDEDFAAMIKDGIYEDECGYSLVITHAN